MPRGGGRTAAFRNAPATGLRTTPTKMFDQLGSSAAWKPPTPRWAQAASRIPRVGLGHSRRGILSHTRFTQRLRPLVQATSAIAVEGTPEYVLALARRERKQGHGRTKLQIIRRAEDRVNRSPLDGQRRFGAQDQSRPEHGVGKVGAGLVKRADAVELGRCGAPRPRSWGKINHIQWGYEFGPLSAHPGQWRKWTSWAVTNRSRSKGIRISPSRASHPVARW